MATGSFKDSQTAAAAPPRGSCCAPLADPGTTIPQKGVQMGTKMASAIGESRIDQEAVNPSGGALRGSNNPTAGTGADDEDQTAAVEPPGGKRTCNCVNRDES